MVQNEQITSQFSYNEPGISLFCNCRQISLQKKTSTFLILVNTLANTKVPQHRDVPVRHDCGHKLKQGRGQVMTAGKTRACQPSVQEGTAVLGIISAKSTQPKAKGSERRSMIPSESRQSSRACAMVAMDNFLLEFDMHRSHTHIHTYLRHFETFHAVVASSSLGTRSRNGLCQGKELSCQNCRLLFRA